MKPDPVLGVTCPTCGAKPDVACIRAALPAGSAHHAARVDAERGIPLVREGRMVARRARRFMNTTGRSGRGSR